LKANINRISALSVSRISVFAALYVVTSFIPISMFIGAPSFLALNLILAPTIAILFSPIEAFLSALFGGVIGLYVAPMQAMFGPFTILLPVAGATFGSLAFHKKKLGLITVFFLLISISAYLIKNSPFPYFVAPHLLAVFITILGFVKKINSTRVRIPLYTFVSTMCEQGMMMIFAVHLLGLPWQVFPGILPLMVYERIVGAIGGMLIILAIRKAIPNYIQDQ